MCVGGIGTVPVAGSVGACTCGLDRQWGRRGGQQDAATGSAGNRFFFGESSLLRNEPQYPTKGFFSPASPCISPMSYPGLPIVL